MRPLGWFLSSLVVLAVLFTALVMLRPTEPAPEEPDRVVIIPGPHGGSRECVRTETVLCSDPAL